LEREVRGRGGLSEIFRIRTFERAQEGKRKFENCVERKKKFSSRINRKLVFFPTR